MEAISILDHLKLCKGKMITDIILPGWIESISGINTFINSDFLIILLIDMKYYHFYLENGIVKMFVKNYIDQVNIVDESDMRCVFGSKEIFGIYDSKITDIEIHDFHDECFASVKFQLDDNNCVFIWSNSISLSIGRSQDFDMWFDFQDSYQYKLTRL